MIFMRIHYLFVAVFTAGALAAPLRAQDTKPGGLNKVAHDVSKTAKKAGKDTKAEVHRDASKTHRTLKKAGNDTKAELKHTTGVTTPAPDADHKPGGLNKAARDVSHASKKAGAKAKHSVKRTAAEAHGELSKSGKDAKQAIKDSIKKP
jgi:gas vesicle protein